MRIKSNQTSASEDAAAAGASPEQAAATGLFQFAARSGKASRAAAPAEAAPAAKRKGWFSRAAKPAAEKRVPPAADAGLFVSPAQANDVTSDEALVVDAAPVGEAPSPKLKASRLGGLFGSKKPAPGDAASSRQEPAKAASPISKKPVKPAKPAKRKAASAGADHIFVELEDGTPLIWAVRANGLTAVAQSDVAGRIASFSSKDFRYNTDLPLSHTAAHSMAVAEVGEEARVINASKTERAVYAATTARVDSFAGLAIGPGLLLLEGVLPFNDGHGQDRVTGVQLLDDDGNLGLVVLYHITPQGEVGSPQVTVNPGELSFVLSQFLASRRLDADSTQLTLLKNDDLLRAFENFRAYPSQASVLGLPLSTALTGLASVAVIAALASAGYTGLGYVTAESAKTALARANADKSAALRASEELLKTSLVSFAQTQALNAETAAKTAQQVWVPGAKVSVEATLTSTVYKVDMPLTTLSGGVSVLHRVENSTLQTLLDHPAPEGCTKSVLNLSGGLNAAQTTVECQNADGSLRSYRLD